MQNFTVDVDQEELSYSIVDFLFNKLVIKILVYFLKAILLAMIIIQALLIYYNQSAGANKILFIIFATTTIIYLKNMASYIINKISLKRSNSMKIEYELQNKYLKAKITNNGTPHQELKIYLNTIRKVIITNKNLMIPISGLQNAGKFVFIPKRFFNEKIALHEIVEYFTSRKVKIKYC